MFAKSPRPNASFLAWKSDLAQMVTLAQMVMEDCIIELYTNYVDTTRLREKTTRYDNAVSTV